MFNPYIRGWINYYRHFYHSALYPTLRRIDDLRAVGERQVQALAGTSGDAVTGWRASRHRLAVCPLGCSMYAAEQWEPDERESHVRFWERAGMQLPRATRLVVRIAGKHMYLWRAVDHEGEVLEILVQRRRDRSAAVKLMRKLLRKQGFAPRG